ncbi:MAG: hypothetical protein KDA80_14390 [Planctomycetaceae bacterium]|nr:hypothetical protein [Planctomycetaceae bacterium]
MVITGVSGTRDDHPSLSKWHGPGYRRDLIFSSSGGVSLEVGARFDQIVTGENGVLMEELIAD